MALYPPQYLLTSILYEQFIHFSDLLHEVTPAFGTLHPSAPALPGPLLTGKLSSNVLFPVPLTELEDNQLCPWVPQGK